MSPRCYIVPPHLLRGIADSTVNSAKVREAAQASLAAHDRITTIRKERFAALGEPRGFSRPLNANLNRQQIIPDGLLRFLSTSEEVDEDTRGRAQRDLDHLGTVMSRVPGSDDNTASEQKPLSATGAKEDGRRKEHTYRAIYNAGHTMSEDELPGKLIRAEGQKKSSDKPVNEAFDNVGSVLQFYKDVFQWNSIDNKNMNVISSVHFGKAYENAFWDPEKLQMVFGDGDEFLGNFTNCVDVIGHELTHAVTEHTSPLDYSGQPGALNEHVSDVFGIQVKQKQLGQTAEQADWLIGEDCILPGVKGTALRSMKAPGTAYNDPRFGKDPQVGNMKYYKSVYEDNGGVHINSGIPNKAFYLVATAFGGNSWEKAGHIWWKTMKSGRIPSKCTFKQFADVTIDVAKEEFGEEGAVKVQKAWDDVGVTKTV